MFLMCYQCHKVPDAFLLNICQFIILLSQFINIPLYNQFNCFILNNMGSVVWPQLPNKKKRNPLMEAKMEGHPLTNYHPLSLLMKSYCPKMRIQLIEDITKSSSSPQPVGNSRLNSLLPTSKGVKNIPESMKNGEGDNCQRLCLSK